MVFQARRLGWLGYAMIFRQLGWLLVQSNQSILMKVESILMISCVELISIKLSQVVQSAVIVFYLFCLGCLKRMKYGDHGNHFPCKYYISIVSLSVTMLTQGGRFYQSLSNLSCRYARLYVSMYVRIQVCKYRIRTVQARFWLVNGFIECFMWRAAIWG